MVELTSSYLLVKVDVDPIWNQGSIFRFDRAKVPAIEAARTIFDSSFLPLLAFVAQSHCEHRSCSPLELLPQCPALSTLPIELRSRQVVRRTCDELDSCSRGM